MRTKKYIIIIAALLFGQELCAQVYDIVERRNLWNTSNNVTGIRLDSITTSYAQAHFTYEHGNFVNYYEPKNSWNAGVIAKTLVHEKKYSMIGAVEFNHKDGKDMCGSMFINPGFYPVDILEFTPGDKKLQKYGIMGGIAVDVADNWRIGAKMDFKARSEEHTSELKSHSEI